MMEFRKYNCVLFSRYKRDLNRVARSPQVVGVANTEPTPVGGGANGKREAWPMVRIHNIRSSLPRPEIEMIYTVSKGRERVKTANGKRANCSGLSFFGCEMGTKRGMDLAKKNIVLSTKFSKTRRLFMVHFRHG